MSQFEYRVIAAPTRGIKAKGAKTAEDRFSNALELLMNEMAAEGWEYQRAETLPSVERSGLTSTTTQWRNVLVFRRAVQTESEMAPAVDKRNEPPLTAAPLAQPLPDIVAPKTQDDDASRSAGASRMLRDNGVEELSEVSGLTNSLTQLAAARSSKKSED